MLILPVKRYRAAVIRQYLTAQKRDRVVCFTCGHAAAELTLAGLDVLEIGPRGGLRASEWWSPQQIGAAFPERFDATAGHLPLHLMREIAARIRQTWRPQQQEYAVPSGSGETALCVKLAYPQLIVHACYDDREPATAWHPQAPLNQLVAMLCVVHREPPPAAVAALAA